MAVITKKLFDTLADGRKVYSYTIDGGEGVSATILDLGGIIQSLFVSDKEGKYKNVVLGFDSAEPYAMPGIYFSAIIGRCANRIKKSRFTLDGKEYILPDNDNSNQLHGGPVGFNSKIWDCTVNGDNSLTLTLESPDGDMGYPGNVQVRVTYAVVGRRLEIRYKAITDAPTVINLTNHAYFDMAGAGSGRTMDNVLWLDCDIISETDKQLIPTGVRSSALGTPYDFTAPKPVGQDIDCDYGLLSHFGGYDTNYYRKNHTNDAASPVATLFDPESGRKMTVITDLPCVQLYTTNSLTSGIPPFSGGVLQSLHCGICLETQFAPDAINSDEAECVILRPGEEYSSYTAFDFGEYND